MSILKLFCPTCDKPHQVGSNAFKPFNCDRCGGWVTQYCTVQQQNKLSRIPFIPPPPSTPKQTKSEKFGTYAFIGTAAVLGIVALFALIITVGNKLASFNRQTNSNNSVQQAPVSSTTTANQANSTNEQPNYQLCNVRLVNTLQGTDKTGGYKAVMNIETKTLTLTYINNANEIIQIISNGGGLNTLRFYNNGSLEAEKTVYRRTDLENGNKEIVYTTRTEQVKIVITYD
jgi:endogenous inhibitor of DNA gyrase (YacG/DUF329 family)